MKKFALKNHSLSIIILSVLICTALLICLCSCESFNDTSFIDDDYIEVEQLRINEANIYMSSSGEPSSYQLEVRTIPENATNRKLSYYISSDYHQYVTVSSSGKLTAHKVSKGMAIPITITSTSNKKATLQASVIIEDVAVNRIRFNKEKISLLYNGEDGQIDFTYEPYHATDGRNAIFTSLNENICRVNNSGVVTPVGVGNATVKVTCTTRTGKLIEDFISIEVAYATGQYQLDVSGSPSFNQVIGDYSPIDFTLLILGENVDPNPDIAWYVDTERIPENQDSTQYSHVPTSTSQLTYYVYAYVTPYQGATVTLKSKPITVYRAFNGITLSYDNLSSEFDSYRYGDTVTFPLKSGDSSGIIVKYKWYLAETANTFNPVLIAETLPSDKDLTRRLNVSGDYSLTVHGVDINENIVSNYSFTFSSDKIVDGDTLVVRPNLLSYGLPPDSYHYYTVSCDENGNYNPEDKVLFKNTPSDAVLYMPVASGNFRIIVTASIGGVMAQISQNGKKVPYEYVSDVIRVYSTSFVDEVQEYDLIDPTNAEQKNFGVTYYNAVEKITVEGIGRDESLVYLKWNTIQASPFYLIELTKDDGSVIIIDSSEDNNCLFGSNYCYLPASIITLKDKFSIRIKQKGGFYSRSFYYGTPNELGIADETHILTYDDNIYPYFETIGYNNVNNEYSASVAKIMDSPALNAYIFDMEDLREFISFTLLYCPSVNTYIQKSAIVIGEKHYNSYKANMVIPFEYTSDMLLKYPHNLTEKEIDNYGEFANYAKLIFGAVSSLPYGFDFVLSFERTIPGITVTFNSPMTSDNSLKNTETPKGKPSISKNYSINDALEVDSSFLPIDLKDEVYVHNSDELVFAIEQGFCPVPQANDSLVILYKLIKDTVIRLTTKEMTNQEKLLAFYDFIALNTTIDKEIDKIALTTYTKIELYLYEAFRLEGVFTKNRTAVSTGIAKAFTTMCGISGIPCLTVTGKVSGKEHTFNKVFLDGSWYIIDISKAMSVIDGYSVVSHDFFMIDELEYSAMFDSEINQTIIYGNAPTCLGTIKKNYTLIQSQSDILEYMARCAQMEDGYYCLDMEFAKNVFVDVDSIQKALSKIASGEAIPSKNVSVIMLNNKIIRVVVLVTVTKE